MKTLLNTDVGHVVQQYTLKDNSIVKSVIYTDKSESMVRYYLRYYHNEMEISREIFEIYKNSVHLANR